METIKSVLNKFPALKIAIVFGSISRDQQTPQSDLDIAVAAEKPLSTEYKERLISALADAVGRPIDLIDLLRYEEPILSKVLTTGKVIYKTDSALYGELIKRMLFDQADFMPLRNRILEERKNAWINS